jgi:hypothetical protein
LYDALDTLIKNGRVSAVLFPLSMQWLRRGHVGKEGLKKEEFIVQTGC